MSMLTVSPLSTNTNVGLHLRRRAEMQPDVEALVDYDQGLRFTYAELYGRAARVANALLSNGLAPGDRVALLTPNCHQFVEVFYGAALAGMIVVPLNWRLVAKELEFIVSDAGAKALFFTSEFAQLTAEVASLDTPVQHWVQVGAGQLNDGAMGYESFLGDAAVTVDAVGARDDDPLFIMYTSGTTGLPKGVVHTHATVEWAVITVLATVDVRHDDRYLLSLPLFHVGALNPLITLIYRGGTGVLARSFDPTTVWQIYKEESITTTLAVPAMLAVMLTTVPDEVPTTLRWIMSGAAPVPPALIESYLQLGLEIHQVYGLTESGGPACVIGSADAVDRIGSTGKAFFHTSVRLIDAHGNDVEPNEPGEVIVAGRHIMKEYWNRPDATAETVRDGWLHTGDLAVYDDDGFVFIRDRVKDMIISGGENVYPAEIESLLVAHPDIADAAVIGIPSKRWGESPLAVVVRSNPALDEAAVLAHCTGSIARYKEPRAVVFTDVITRNPTGKILKRELRDQYNMEAPE